MSASFNAVVRALCPLRRCLRHVAASPSCLFRISIVLAAIYLSYAIYSRFSLAYGHGLLWYYPQSRENIEFMYAKTLAEAFGNFSPEFPVLFPLLSWSAHQLTGVGHDAFSFLLMWVTIILGSVVFYRAFQSRMPVFYLCFFAIFPPVYCLADQFMSEFPMVIGAMGSIYFLDRYIQDTKRKYFWLCLLFTVVAGLSRYQACIWLYPVVVACLLVLARGALWRRIKVCLLFGVAASIPVVGYMAHLKTTTGHWSGMDRVGGRQVDYLNNSFEAVTGDMLKTLYADFFWPFDYGSKEAVTYRVDLDPLPLLMLFASACGLVFVTGAVSRLLELGRRRNSKNLESGDAFEFIVLLSVMSYLTTTYLAWQVLNNDPLYTRFVAPSYFLLIPAVWYVWRWYWVERSDRWAKAGAITLAIGFLCVVSVSVLKVSQALFYGLLGATSG